MKLNGDEIISSEDISIEKVPEIKSLNPLTVIAAYPTEFKVSLKNSDEASSVSKYVWDFGDNKTKTTTENKVIHTYDKIKNYVLKVSISNNNSFSSDKTFNITVKNPKDAINDVLNQKLDSLNKIKSEINGFDSFEQTSLSGTIGVDNLENSLSSLQQRNASAVSDDDYVNIMKDLINLSIPDSVFKSKVTQPIKFYPSEENVNVGVLQSIAGGDYGSEGDIQKAVLAWYLDNVDADITSSEFSADYDNSISKVSTFFKISINSNPNRGDSFFVMPLLDNLKFKEDYQDTEINGYTYINIPPEGKTIEFSTTENLDFNSLPAFVSPSISELPIISANVSPSQEKLPKIAIIILSVILALIIGFILYLILQTWYKKKYEDYLFKNKNNLYNMVIYIQNSKKKGVSNEEIEKRLRKSGWHTEQIDYVMRKYAGKRTGLIEIPIGKVLKIFSKKDPDFKK